MKVSDFVKKAAGLVFEFDETQAVPQGAAMSDDDFKKMMASSATGPTKTMEQVVRDAPGPNLEDIKMPESAKPQPQALKTDGSVDFKAIYSMANVQDAPFTAEQLIDLLATLPPELPLEARRQTVKITIQAMAKTVAVTPEIIVADASRKLKALASYEESYGKQADEFVAKTEAEIKALEAQIAAKKVSIEDAKQKHDSMNKACVAEGDRLDDVLEFFSLDVAPSKFA
jgi:hypothetical protein